MLVVAVVTLSGCLFSNHPARGQNAVTETRDKTEIPAREKFAVSHEVVIPWRDSDNGCDGVRSAVKWPDCPELDGTERNLRSTLTLYNEDGTLWYRFSILWTNDGAPDFVGKDVDFYPLAPKKRTEGLASYVVLRLVGESAHWYEVEVNEQTRATKFILKSDPNWTKASWGFLFNWSRRIYVDQDRVKLRDKPGGEVIKEYQNFHYDALIFRKIDGDWIYVEGIRNYFTPNLYYGWIRWRKGRDILVGSILNNNKIPETGKEEKDQ